MQALIALAGMLALYVYTRKSAPDMTNASPAKSANLNAHIMKAEALRSKHSAFIIIAASKYQVPPRLLDAIIHLESSDGTDLRPGSAGEIGAMQIIPTTFADIKRQHPELALYRLENIPEALTLAAAHCADGFKILRDWEKVALGYNVGFNSKKVHDFSQPYYLRLRKFFGV